MERLLGRCYIPNQGVIKYLVAYEGWDTTSAVSICFLMNDSQVSP